MGNVLHHISDETCLHIKHESALLKISGNISLKCTNLIVIYQSTSSIEGRVAYSRTIRNCNANMFRIEETKIADFNQRYLYRTIILLIRKQKYHVSSLSQFMIQFNFIHDQNDK